MLEQLVDYKEQARATWALGDYDAMVRQERLDGIGEQLVERLAVTRGERVLDVACGTGNASIPAARTGASVTGLDLTPELLDAARRNADRSGVEVTWTRGDAEELPFDDDEFDVVLSTFGCMFAPRHEVVAGELARVLRPGGRIGLCSWTPDGVFGAFFRIVAAHLPPDPSFVDPPVQWGDEDAVRRLFEGTGITFRFAREQWWIEHDTAEAAARCYTTTLGPVVAARRHTEEQGRRRQLDDELVALFASYADADTGRVRFGADYLLAAGRADH